MKFKVAYTVDLKDVPDELNKILQKVKNTFTIKISDQIDSACREMIVNQNFSDAHSMIHDVREAFLSIDHTLGDCMEGMSQYVEIYNSLADEKSDNESELEPSPVATLPNEEKQEKDEDE